jgi:hypothetical protein
MLIKKDVLVGGFICKRLGTRPPYEWQIHCKDGTPPKDETKKETPKFDFCKLGFGPSAHLEGLKL